MAQRDLENHKLLIQDSIFENFQKDNWRAALAIYREVKRTKNYNYERAFNTYGYELLGKGHSKKAVQIFTLNAEENPSSWNAHDSLGEAYEVLGNSEKAVECYQLSLSLNPGNTHAAERIQSLCQ